MGKKRSKEDQDLVAQLYNEGKSYNQIIQLTGIPKTSVGRLLRLSKIRIRSIKKDLINQRFGRLLTIKEDSPDEKNQKTKWICLCDCGNTCSVRGNDLLTGKIKSCGCLHKETSSENGRKMIKISEKLEQSSSIPDWYIKNCIIGANNRNITYNISKEYLQELFIKQNKKCALSGVNIYFSTRKKTTASLDRIDSSKDYIEGNVQWVHKDINLMKGAISDNRFIDLCTRVAKNTNLKIGYLYNTRVYLGGHIENAADFIGWRDTIRQRLEPISVICLDPTKDMFIKSFRENKKMNEKLKQWRQNGEFDKLQKVMKKIVSKDLRAVDICDFTIFRIDPLRPTYGTIHEFVNAAMDRKPMLIWIDDKKQMPLWLLRYVELECIFDNLESLVTYIFDINSGKIKLDNKFWKILQPEYRLGLKLDRENRLYKKEKKYVEPLKNIQTLITNNQI